MFTARLIYHYPMRPLSYWESACDVRPSPSADAPERTDVLIVGAGFAGSWLAYFLKKRDPKREILIVERDFLGLGASTRNAGFLSCGNLSEWLEDSHDLGWEETVRTLQARIEGIQIIRAEIPALPVENCGSIDLDPLTQEKLDLMKRLNEVRRLFMKRAVLIAGKTREASFNEFDAAVNPCELLLLLHQTLQKLGVKFLWQTNVLGVGKGTAHLHPNQGLRYERAFLCTNAFSGHLNPNTTVEPARGQILVTSPCQTDTQKSLGFLRSGYDYFRFIDDRVLVGGGRLHFKQQESTDALETSNELRQYLVRVARSVIGHDDFTVDFHWSGIMGLRRGGHASISELKKPTILDSKTEEIAGFGGWGVTLAPALAQHVAERY